MGQTKNMDINIKHSIVTFIWKLETWYAHTFRPWSHVNIGIKQFLTTIINRKTWGDVQYILDFIRFTVEIPFFTRKSPFLL